MSERRSKKPSPWETSEILARINRARGALLARTGKDVAWKDIGSVLPQKSSSSLVEVRYGRRPYRIAEIAVIAGLLECSPGWLAFGEGQLERVPDMQHLQSPAQISREEALGMAGDAPGKDRRRRA